MEVNPASGLRVESSLCVFRTTTQSQKKLYCHGYLQKLLQQSRMLSQYHAKAMKEWNDHTVGSHGKAVASTNYMITVLPRTKTACDWRSRPPWPIESLLYSRVLGGTVPAVYRIGGSGLDWVCWAVTSNAQIFFRLFKSKNDPNAFLEEIGKTPNN